MGCAITGLISLGHPYNRKQNYGAGKLCPNGSDFVTYGASTNITNLCQGVGSKLPSVAAEFYGTFIFTAVILSVKSGLTASE